MKTKRGIYIYGSPGSGKTRFVRDILKKLDYDVILFDAGDFRNKTIIDTITKHNNFQSFVLSAKNKNIMASIIIKIRAYELLS
jgi:adenylate kinase family enzyme